MAPTRRQRRKILGEPMGSRQRARDRINEIRKRNPAAIPAWMNAGASDPAWYRASWQTDGGVAADDAARPAIVILKWLSTHGVLASTGMDALRVAADKPAGAEITHRMVTPKGKKFLDRFFDTWWDTAGSNVALGSENVPLAVAALDQMWTDFGRK